MIDVQYLKKTANRSIFNQSDPKWLEAFNDYNNNNEHKLGLKCRGCYYKVLQFHEEREKKQTNQA